MSRAWTSAVPGPSRRLAWTLYAAVSMSGVPLAKAARVASPEMMVTPSPEAV